MRTVKSLIRLGAHAVLLGFVMTWLILRVLPFISMGYSYTGTGNCCKNPKNWDTWKNCCNYPTIWTVWFYHAVRPPKDTDGIANSETAPSRAVWTVSSKFGTYRLCEQRRFRRACASAQSRQNLCCSLIQALSQEEPSDRKPDPWPLWMAGHAQLKFVMTECSKTQIRLTGLSLI